MPNMIYVSVKQQVKSFFGKNFRLNMSCSTVGSFQKKYSAASNSSAAGA
jgi:hypothetical protein